MAYLALNDVVCRLVEKRWGNEITRRLPQNLSKNKAEACSKEIIEDYFIKFEAVIKQCDLEKKPTRIFNYDEFGFRTDAGQKHFPMLII